TNIPARFDGKTLEEVNLRREYNLIALTTIESQIENNAIGVKRKVSKVQGVASANTILKHGDIMVLYGHNKDLKRLLRDNNSKNELTT
ncbi:MAG: TrkA C-terminal domain-containing protein, partial [Flavobacteriaceae bacterium]|nr:TrkA C-terminal domain-containing protein [Flavobacteriaceae bacterium]